MAGSSHHNIIETDRWPDYTMQSAYLRDIARLRYWRRKVGELMNKDISKGKVKQTKGELKQKMGKVSGNNPQLEISKVCPSCQNPRWDKTPRKS
jgi:hypothetical protein